MAFIIDSDFWDEVLKTISMRRRQSLMTAFGVFWGILILTLLLGASLNKKLSRK